MSSNTARYQNVIKCSGFRNLKNETPIQIRDHSVYAVQELSIGFTTVMSFFLKGKSNNCMRTGMVPQNVGGCTAGRIILS